MVENIRSGATATNLNSPGIGPAHVDAPFGPADLTAAKGFAGLTAVGTRLLNALPSCEDVQQGIITGEKVTNVGVKASRVLLAGETIEDVLTGGTHNATTSGKLIAGLGTAGGAVQSLVGVNQLAHGEIVEGVKNTGAGALATAAGAVELKASLAVARKAVPLLAGASGVVEGVGDIVQAVKTDDVEKGVVGGAKAIGGAMLGASPFLAATGIGAPAAVVIGAAGGVILAGAEIYDALGHFWGGKK